MPRHGPLHFSGIPMILPRLLPLPALLVLSWIVSATCVAAETSSSIPKIAVDKLDQDFGTVQRGSVVSEDFSISNGGSATLVIESASFSMPGMNLRVAQRIEPGQTTPLKVVWDTSGYSRHIKGQVVLQTNDPVRPKVVLTLTGTVLSPIDVFPVPAFYLSQFQGQSEAQSIIIQNNQDRHLRIAGIEYDSTLFSVRNKEIEPGKRFQLEAIVSPEAPVGRYREAIVVRTDDPDRPRIRIEVNILVKPDVFVNEDQIDFGEVGIATLKRDPAKLKLLTESLIVSRRQGDMSITGWESDIPFLTLAYDPRAPSQRFRIDVGLDLDNLRPGFYSGLIRLRTDDSRFAELRIPVQIRVTE